MATSQRIVAGVLVLLLVVPGLAFARQRLRLDGKIVDPKGKAIEGVAVTVTSPQVTNFRVVQTTDKKGTFTVDLPQNNVTYIYRFEKAGYVTLQANQDWTLDGSGHFQWTMQPGSGPEIGGAPPASTSEPAVLAYNAGVAAVKAKDLAHRGSEVQGGRGPRSQAHPGVGGADDG